MTADAFLERLGAWVAGGILALGVGLAGVIVWGIMTARDWPPEDP